MIGTETAKAGRGATIGQAAWMAWEGAIGKYMEWRSAGSYRFGICKVLLKKHHGRAIVCEDGTRIERGDWVGELHLDNATVLSLTSSAASSSAALATARLARDAVRQIYFSMETHPELRKIKALVGITLLHRGLVHGLGFEHQRLPSRMEERFCALYLRLLLRFMHPDGGRRVRGQGEKLVPMRLVHSRESLRRRFGADPSSPAEGRTSEERAARDGLRLPAGEPRRVRTG